jgi:hypothetical protein
VDIVIPEKRKRIMQISMTHPISNKVCGPTELLPTSSALEENDIVAAGDILEYEFPDRLQIFPICRNRHLLLAGK